MTFNGQILTVTKSGSSNSLFVLVSLLNWRLSDITVLIQRGNLSSRDCHFCFGIALNSILGETIDQYFNACTVFTVWFRMSSFCQNVHHGIEKTVM